MANKVTRVTTTGQFTEWDLVSDASPIRIETGPDGARWFTELYAGNLGRITSDGQLTQTR